LKLFLTKPNAYEVNLLIEPQGIETICLYSQTLGNYLLIEPQGIETSKPAIVRSFGGLLIEPQGIETIVFCSHVTRRVRLLIEPQGIETG